MRSPELVCLFSTHSDFYDYMAAAPSELHEAGIFKPMYRKFPNDTRLQAVQAEGAVERASSAEGEGSSPPRPGRVVSRLLAVQRMLPVTSVHHGSAVGGMSSGGNELTDFREGGSGAGMGTRGGRGDNVLLDVNDERESTTSLEQKSSSRESSTREST